MKEVVPRRVYYLFSPFLRIFHWVMVDSIIVLFVTGILIGKPPEILNLEPSATMLLMDVVRKLHFLAAFVFCASFILRVYGFIVNRGDRLFPAGLGGPFL
jgi:Ni/Fe-hydrogenase 1 B-type cytochrome subunit